MQLILDGAARWVVLDAKVAGSVRCDRIVAHESLAEAALIGGVLENWQRVVVFAVVIQQELAEGDARNTGFAVFRKDFFWSVNIPAEHLRVQIFNVITFGELLELVVGVAFGIVKFADEEGNANHQGANANHG